MKKSVLTISTVLLWTCHQDAFSQEWGGARMGKSRQLYSVNVNAGVLSYFGDLSLYDDDPVNKLKYESRPGFGVIATRHFRNMAGISGQILYGQLKGSNNIQKFSAGILEYNLHLRIDLVGLFMAGRDHRVGLVPYAGIGQFLFRTKTTTYKNGQENKSENSSRVPEFVYFAGAGLFCRLNSNLALTADLALRQCRNDKLDGLVKNDNFDYYSFLNMGITYHFGTKAKNSLRNKARVAHGEHYFSRGKKRGRR